MSEQTMDSMYEEARLALLTVIARQTNQTGAKQLLELAEAYAWLTSCEQAH